MSLAHDPSITVGLVPRHARPLLANFKVYRTAFHRPRAIPRKEHETPRNAYSLTSTPLGPARRAQQPAPLAHKLRLLTTKHRHRPQPAARPRRRPLLQPPKSRPLARTHQLESAAKAVPGRPRRRAGFFRRGRSSRQRASECRAARTLRLPEWRE